MLCVMSTNVREMACSAEDVFAVLADGWLFPTWVVGASRMRDVEKAWPAVIDDETTMHEWDPPRHALVVAKGWPIGEASVQIDVKPRGDGCVVRIIEKAVAGPGKYVPPALLDIALYIRNVETLRRLAYIAEGKADGK
jgi:hypothetical protein